MHVKFVLRVGILLPAGPLVQLVLLVSILQPATDGAEPAPLVHLVLQVNIKTFKNKEDVFLVLLVSGGRWGVLQHQIV